MKVWINGNLVDEKEATLSVFDHGLLYGDGVFEGIRAYGGRLFRSDAHVGRFFASAEAIRLTIPLARREIVDAMYLTMKANDIADGYLRLVATRGAGTLGLNPFECTRPTVFIIADQIALYGPDMYENGMPVIIARTRRTSATMLSPAIKSLNYLNNIMAKIEAVDAGAAEAIMLNADGQLAEASGDNIFIVRDGTVITSPPESGILRGITRGVVADLCVDMGIPFAERAISVEQLYAADECFLTGTAAEIIAVNRVDGKVIGAGRPGPITVRLLEAFRKLVRAAPAEE